VKVTVALDTRTGLPGRREETARSTPNRDGAPGAEPGGRAGKGGGGGGGWRGQGR
jgi:hypothetical protein